MVAEVSNSITTNISTPKTTLKKNDTSKTKSLFSDYSNETDSTSNSIAGDNFDKFENERLGIKETDSEEVKKQKKKAGFMNDIADIGIITGIAGLTVINPLLGAAAGVIFGGAAISR